MSTVNVRPSTNAAGAVGYILYGRDPEVRKELLKVGSTRAAAYAMSGPLKVWLTSGFMPPV